MPKTKTILIASFILVFVAGIPFGWAIDQRTGAPDDRSWLGRRLDLSADQEKEIAQIWAEVSQTSHSQRGDAMRNRSEERDDEIRALLTEEQKTAFEEIASKHRDARSQYFGRVRTLNDEAVEKTKALLTDQQRAEYETIIEHHRAGNGLGPRHGSRRPKNH